MEKLLIEIKQQLTKWPEWQQAKTIVLALSGGVDSMVLFDIIIRLLAQIDTPPQLIVAHFNHQLRLESHQEADQLREWVENKGIIYFGGQWSSPLTSNVEAAARQARYQFLADVVTACQADLLLTAHHQDDAAETFMMKLVRGTSLKGLQGLRANEQRILLTSEGEKISVRLLRPLIGINKAMIYNYAQIYNLPYFEDTSNQSEAYTRNRYRHQYLPSLAKENTQLAKTLSQMQDQLQISYQVHYQHFLQLEPQIFFQQMDQVWTVYLPTLLALSSAEQLLYLTIFFEERLIEVLPSYHHSQIKHILELVQPKQKPNVRIDLGHGWIGYRAYDYFYIRPNLVVEKQANEAYSLSVSQDWLHLSDGSQVILMSYDVYQSTSPQADMSVLLSLESKLLPLEVRHPRRGDRLLLGDKQNPYHKKISRLMIDQKVPQLDRSKQWLLTSSIGDIIWLEPNTISQLYSHPQTGTITHVFLYRKANKYI